MCILTLLPLQPLFPDPLRYEQGASCSRHHGRERCFTCGWTSHSDWEPEETLPPLVTVTRKVPKTKPRACGSKLWGEPERFWGNILSLLMLWLPLLILLSSQSWGRHDQIGHHLDKAESIRTLQDAQQRPDLLCPLNDP